MKKVLILLVAFLAFTESLFAQFLLHEGFDESILPAGWTLIDSDGDGHNWGPYMLPEAKVHEGAGCISSESYDNNVERPLNPDNWLITPAITLGPADTMAGLMFYVSGQDPEWAEENYGVYVSTTGTAVDDFTSIFQGTSTRIYQQKNIELGSYAGQTIYIAFRHYNTTDQFRLNIDEVTVVDGPAITAKPMILDFNVEVDHMSVKPIEIMGLFPAAGITATLSEGTPFAISLNNVNYSQSIDLPSANNTLYVRYQPEMAGRDTGWLTLSSIGASEVTVLLAGNTYDCSNVITLPYLENFDSCFLPSCWTTIDANRDYHDWKISCENGVTAHSGNGVAVSESFSLDEDRPLAPDNWLITPPVTLDGIHTELGFWIAPQDPLYPEYYGVYVSTEGHDNVNSFTGLFEGTATEGWVKHLIDLSSYAGQTIYIAFRHYNSINQFWLNLDDVSIDRAGAGVEEKVLVNAGVYPNPARTTLNVTAAHDIRDIVIYDLTGTRITSYSNCGCSTRINISNLANGMYFIKIKTDDGMTTRKFNVVR